jgi:hypothetical protein
MSAYTPTPWRYRTDHYDDWGWIKGPDGAIVACARAGRSYDGDEHRAAGIDPYGPNAAFIVKACNSHEALVKALTELYAMVKGECPSLLNEDSGGNPRLDLEIQGALAAAGRGSE